MPPSESVFVSFLFGGGLLLAALFFARRHGASWNSTGSATDKLTVAAGAARRRTWIVGLLIALGILIPLGDLWLTWHRDPRWFAVYVLAVLGGSLWLLGLGVCEALFVFATAMRRNRSGLD